MRIGGGNMELTEEYIKNLAKCMKINIEAEILENEDIFKVTLVSDNNAILIGKEGKMASSIRTLIQAFAYLNNIKNVKINIDSF